MMDKYDIKTAERFINKVDFDSSDCWDWVGSKNELGYGTMRYRGRVWKAHRVSYLLFNGDPENGLVIDHTCKNRSCVNPLHLEEVTQKENLQRKNN
jgi:hypothetical protein